MCVCDEMCLIFSSPLFSHSSEEEEVEEEV